MDDVSHVATRRARTMTPERQRKLRLRRRVVVAVTTGCVSALASLVLRRRRIDASRRECGRVVAARVRYGSRAGFTRRPMFPQLNGRAKWEHGWEESYWWVRLRTVATEGDSHELMLKTVERKLRLPWSVFDSLAREMERDPALQERKLRAVPLRLKLCSALRHLATGHSFDGLEESFKMSAQTMRRFFWAKFLPWMMAHKYDESVYAPKNLDELQEVCEEYAYAGFPGCCGSVDGVHVPWYGYKAGARADFVGKEKVPTLVFGVTVDHRYRIMHVTDAHAGAANDKFVIRADEFHTRTMHTALYKDYTFDLYASRDRSTTRYKGCYVLCDGGYADWRNLLSGFSCVEPFSPRANWSHRVGSVRKDSECTFGVLKARFRVLTSRIHRRNATDVGNLFKVCCCLHNMIMRARNVRPGMGKDNLLAVLADCNADEGEDLQDTNARGQTIWNVHSPAIAIDNGADDDTDDTDDTDVHNAAPAHDVPDDANAEELVNKTMLQNALVRHWRVYAEFHREEHDGYHPFVYSGSKLARQRFDAINGGR